MIGHSFIPNGDGSRFRIHDTRLLAQELELLLHLLHGRLLLQLDAVQTNNVILGFAAFDEFVQFVFRLEGRSKLILRVSNRHNLVNDIISTRHALDILEVLDGDLLKRLDLPHRWFLRILLCIQVLRRNDANLERHQRVMDGRKVVQLLRLAIIALTRLVLIDFAA